MPRPRILPLSLPECTDLLLCETLETQQQQLEAGCLAQGVPVPPGCLPPVSLECSSLFPLPGHPLPCKLLIRISVSQSPPPGRLPGCPGLGPVPGGSCGTLHAGLAHWVSLLVSPARRCLRQSARRLVHSGRPVRVSGMLERKDEETRRNPKILGPVPQLTDGHTEALGGKGRSLVQE